MESRIRWSSAAAVAIGTLVGIAAGLSAFWAIPPTEAPAAAATEATTTTAPVPEWFHPGEVVLGPAVLVPESLTIGSSEVAMRYRLEPITPSAAPSDEDVDTAVLPDRWTLVTSSGEVAASTEPWTRQVVFTLPADAQQVGVEGMRLDRYWIRSPVRVPVTLDLESTPVAEVAPGVSIEIVRIMSSSAGTQVVAGLLAEHSFTVSDLAVEGVGGDGLTSSVDQTGTGRWTVSFSTSEAPDPLRLVVRGVVWVPIDTSASIDIDEVPRG